MPSRQTALKSGREPLQIEVPPGFQGARTNPGETEIFLAAGKMTVLTLDEIRFVEKYLESLPYKQSLVFGATMIDANDPLLTATHDDLDKVERSNALPVSRMVAKGGVRSIQERVLIIREAGVWDSLQPVLSASAA